MSKEHKEESNPYISIVLIIVIILVGVLIFFTAGCGLVT